MNTKDIYSKFNGKLVGSVRMKKLVCITLSNMSVEIIDKITKTTWFISSMTDAWAFAFTGNDLKDQHLVFISDHLLEQDDEQIRYSIAHEIGHVVLGHRNSVLERQSKSEVRKQEMEADIFARQFVVE